MTDHLQGNLLIATECRHVRVGELTPVMRLTFEGVDDADPDFRYRPGPDRIELCPLCCGRMLGFFMRSMVSGDRGDDTAADAREGSEDARP